MRKLKKKPIILYILALIVLYVIIYIVPSVTGALVSSYTIEYGQMKVSDETTGYLVRNEQVYTAPAGGKANRYIENGTLVRGGTTIMEVTGSTEKEISAAYTELLGRLSEKHKISSFTAQTSGIISYYADGFEGKLRPDNMERGDYRYYSKLSQKNVKNLQRDSIAEGEPVFKVADRTEWYLVCFVDADHIGRYEEGQDVTVEFEDDFVEAEVRSVSLDKDSEAKKARVVLSTHNYYEKFAQMRECLVKLVTYDERGLLIENDSIAEKNGRKGVYVKNKTNDYIFVPIKVYQTDGTYSLVADTMYYDEKGEQVMTVEIYDEVLKTPKSEK